MNYNPSDSIDKTNLVLDLLARKQEALGSNLANMHTPGYVRQDVSFEQVLSNLDKPLETDLSRKIGPSPIIKQTGGEINVSTELLAMQKNALFYSVATRMMTSKFQEYKTITQAGR